MSTKQHCEPTSKFKIINLKIRIVGGVLLSSSVFSSADKNWQGS